MTPVPKSTPALREPKRMQSRPHRISDRVRRDTLARWGSTCLWCDQPGGALDLHHVTRRSQGGTDTPGNLKPVHRRCHEYIHTHPAEAKRLGFLG